MLYFWTILVSLTVFAQLSSVESQNTVDPVDMACVMPYVPLHVAIVQYKKLVNKAKIPKSPQGYNIGRTESRFKKIRRIAKKNKSNLVTRIKNKLNNSIVWVQTTIKAFPVDTSDEFITVLISSPVTIVLPLGPTNFTLKGVTVISTLSSDTVYDIYDENDTDYDGIAYSEDVSVSNAMMDESAADNNPDDYESD